jgi:hypothetical protein
MKKASTFTRLAIFVVIAILFAPILHAQTQRHMQSKSQPHTQPTEKVSMRQMGMGKMKNSERWKAAIARANHRADHLRKQGKGVK